MPHKIVWKIEGCTRIVRCLQLENDSSQTSQSEPNATIRRLRELLLFKSFLPVLPPKLKTRAVWMKQGGNCQFFNHISYHLLLTTVIMFNNYWSPSWDAGPGPVCHGVYQQAMDLGVLRGCLSTIPNKLYNARKHLTSWNLHLSLDLADLHWTIPETFSWNTSDIFWPACYFGIYFRVRGKPPDIFFKWALLNPRRC